MTWIPRGRIFPPPGSAVPSWIGGYGALPFAVRTGERTARVFFSGRDAANRSHVGACTLDVAGRSIDPESISPEPLVSPGPLGAFDDSGCSMSCVVEQGGRLFLYYSGWMLGRTVPFYLAIGLAISEDGGVTFRKHSAAPLVDRGDVDPFLVASPSVLIDNGTWRMWYVSALGWDARADGPPRHRYLIRYAESRDGLHWTREGRVAIPFAASDEYAMGRPHVRKEGGVYRMEFCVRGDRYRLAHAESPDGFDWTRGDLEVPASDWDAEMQAYPMVLGDLLFYNGNGYGASGFGIAENHA
jgi:hypothetical protein